MGEGEQIETGRVGDEALSEVLAVVGLFNLMNSLADAYQVEPDIFRKRSEAHSRNDACGSDFVVHDGNTSAIFFLQKWRIAPARPNGFGG